MDKIKGLEKYLTIEPAGSQAWYVEIALPSEDVSAAALPGILQVVKRRISEKFDFPLGLLTYEDLIRHEADEQRVGITLKIVRKEADRGDPQLRFEGRVNEDGTDYDNMALYLDLFPLKKDGSPLRERDIWQIIQKAEIDLESVAVDTILDNCSLIQKDLEPIYNILIAEGTLPAPSFDAKLEFLTELNSSSEGGYIGARRLKREERICRRIPSVQGKLTGKNLFGKVLEPRIPQEIRLKVDEGVVIAGEFNEVKASNPGLAKISSPLEGESHNEIIFVIAVESVEVIESDRILKLASDKHIEIRGNLESGSQIITQGEVIVNGDIEQDTSVITAGNLNVLGAINGSYVIEGESDALPVRPRFSTKVMAHGVLKVKGETYKSELVGNEVYLGNAVGSEITVGSYAELGLISPDDKGFSARIMAGKSLHLEKKLLDNQLFIQGSKESLKRITELVGEEIIAEANPANMARMLMLYAKELRKKGISHIPQEHRSDLKYLLASIGPLRDMVMEKEEMNIKFVQQLESDAEGEPEIIFKQGVASPVDLEIAGKEIKILPQEGPLRITVEEGNVLKLKYEAPPVAEPCDCGSEG